MGDLHKKKYRVEGYFDEYPRVGQRVIVRTLNGCFYANYEKWDWSDSNEEPYFKFSEGKDADVLAWEEVWGS